MTSTRERLDDIALAIADTYAMNDTHESLLTDIRKFDSARNFLDALIDDNRDDMTDADIALINANYDTLMMMLSIRLLDFLSAI